MDQPPSRRIRWFVGIPRFGLRTLFIAILVIAAITALAIVIRPRFIRFIECRQYATLQKAREPFVLQWRDNHAKIGFPVDSVDNSRQVPDGFVILVRRGNTFGCFIPRNQRKKGESLEYDWYYRTDALGKFSTVDPDVHQGHSFAGPYIRGQGLVTVNFGPFKIEWSSDDPGWGWLYYGDYLGRETIAADDLRICSTDCKSVEFIDARSAEWIYKAYVRDPGLAGNVDILQAMAKQSLPLLEKGTGTSACGKKNFP